MIKYLRNVKEIFFLIFFIEILSFTAFYFPQLNNLIFSFVATLFFIITLYKFDYGIYIIFGELFIGSMGTLFFLNYNNNILSIRIVMWIIVMSLWITKIFINFFKKENNINFFKSRYYTFFVILFVFILWGIVNGTLRGNSFNNLFFDVNGWFYFSLIFPIYDHLLQKGRDFKETKVYIIIQILIASVAWLSVKTLFLLFIFSHSLHGVMSIFYKWIRDTRIGEITKMSDGFIRIFFQSHIFVLFCFFLGMFFFNYMLLKGNFSLKKLGKNKQTKIFLIFIFALVVIMSVIIIGFSRSFWVGFIFGIICYLLYILYLQGVKKMVLNVFLLLIIFLLSYCLIIFIIKIPLSGNSGHFTIKTVKNRATEIDESAVSSRWSLLPLLWTKMRQNLITGRGFGSTITYKSSDPRVLQKTVDGTYTTYAFEWGWLDIWFKLGFFGVFIYLFLIIKIFIDFFSSKFLFNDFLVSAFVFGLVIISIINFFTPFLNHPLGIGYLILTVIIMDNKTPLQFY